MAEERKDKPQRPWSGFGFVIIAVVAILVGYFIVLPIGQQVRGVFQELTDAFQGKR